MYLLSKRKSLKESRMRILKSSGKITIEADKIKQIKVLTIDGKIVKKINTTESKVEIDLSNEPKASYLIKITTNEKTFVEKIILK